jgi:DNA polymerase
MVIGEAPGQEEDARGEPFVGAAGRLLDKMLAAAGLLDRALITNVVFWRPPGNRNPSLQECAVCSPFLERGIELLRPRAILLLGGASAKAILRQEAGILSLRGRWFEHVSGESATLTPALATLHPAFLLRQPQAKKLAWADLLAVAERVDQPNPV